ncbi:hypothetical protein Saga11_38720 [Bacillus safensis]|nr:hypothetical protein Saga11_38720 [Bacillus safensis]
MNCLPKTAWPPTCITRHVGIDFEWMAQMTWELLKKSGGVFAKNGDLSFKYS